MQKGISYTTILHEPRIKAGLTCNQYVLASTIFHMQNNQEVPGWCYATKEWFADMIGISKQSVINLINELLKKGFVAKSLNGRHLQVTKKWSDEIEKFEFSKESLPKKKVKKVDQNGKDSLPNSVKKVDQETVKKVDPIIIEENNIDIDIENNSTPNGVFSDSNLEDYEKQLANEKAKIEAEKLESDLKAKEAEKEKNLRQKKKNEYEPKTKTVNLMKEMATDFDSAFVFVSGQSNILQFGRIDGIGIRWFAKEFGNLKMLSETLGKMLKEQSGVDAKPEEIRENWRLFLQMAIDTKESFILSNFTPSMLNSQFNSITLKAQQKSNGKNFTTSKRNGHNLDPERTRQQESLLNGDELLNRYRGMGSVG